MKMNADSHIDTALRSVMERRAGRVPTLSDDFAQQVMSKMNARKESVTQQRASTPLHHGRQGAFEQPRNVTAPPQRRANPHSRRRVGWGWVFPIAAVLLIAFLLWPERQEETTTRQEMQPIVAETNPQPVPQPTVEEKQEVAIAEVQPAPQPVKQRRKEVKRQSTPIEEPSLAQAEPIIPAESASQPLVHTQSYHEARVCGMDAGNEEVDSKMKLYAAEVEQEQATHQRQATYEKEMKRRRLELLMYLLTDNEEELPNGTVNTQKS